MGPPLLAPGSLCLVGALGHRSPRSSSASEQTSTHRLRSREQAHADPHDLPRQRRGIDAADASAAIPTSTCSTQADHWDEVTRRVVLDRVENVPPIRFFDDRGGARR